MPPQRPPTPYPVFNRKDSTPSTKAEIVKYCEEMLAKSMLTGVPQIVSAPTTRSKLFKTFVLFGSITGFLYQTSAFLVMYFSYPTLVDVQVTTPPFVDVPAITICNRNGLRREYYCEMYPDNCEPLLNLGNFCESYPESCENGVLKGGSLFPKAEFLSDEGAADQTIINDAGHSFYPLISYCEFEGVNVTFDFCKIMEGKQLGDTRDNASLSHRKKRNNSFHSFIFRDLTGKMKKCYILNARWKEATLNLPQVPTRAVLKMVIDLEPHQYFRLDRDVGGQMTVHSPWNILNPFMEGMQLKPKKTYIIRLKEDIYNLLPRPYQTNCTDYIKKWQIRGKNGPLSKEMCVEECILNQTMDNCQCVLKNNLYPHNFKFCGADTDLCTEKVNYTHCFVQCSPACHSRQFEITVQETDATLGLDEEDAKNQNWNRTIILLFLFKRTQVNVYRYRAKYESIEFFSFLGGFIGIWLGVSLIALFDFLESLATFAVFVFDRMKSSNRIQEIRSAIGSRVRSNSTFSSDSMQWTKPQPSHNLRVNPIREHSRTHSHPGPHLLVGRVPQNTPWHTNTTTD